MIFLKYGALKGSSIEDTHKAWIACNSIQFGVGRGIASAAGGTGIRQASHPSVSEITLSKDSDASSADLFMEALQGKGVDAEIDITTKIGEKTEIMMKLTLKECMISGYSVSSGGDNPSESISINFKNITYQYNANEAGILKQGDEKKWDLAVNKAV